jgi:hypothetical protein
MAKQCDGQSSSEFQVVSRERSRRGQAEGGLSGKRNGMFATAGTKMRLKRPKHREW